MADDRFQKVLIYWRIGPRARGIIRSKNFIVAFREVIGHRIRSILRFRALDNNVEGRVLAVPEVCICVLLKHNPGAPLRLFISAVALGCNASGRYETPRS